MCDEKIWKPSMAVINALHPSTSKDHVLPRLEQSVFVDRKEVFKNFFDLERIQSVSDGYFEEVQLEITAPMRSMLLEWMFEVCEEERCSCEVFPLATSYVDRFLSVEAVHKRQLQALGTACLFIASKVKLINPFSASRLVDYTDDAVPISELLSWEMLVLDRLNWDVSTLTAFDFLDQYVHRLKLPKKLIAGLRPYLTCLVGLSVIDFPMATLPPSLIAASCLQVAATHVFGDLDAGRELMEPLIAMTTMETETIETHARRMHHLFVQKQSESSRVFMNSAIENWCSEPKHLSCNVANDQGSSDNVGPSKLTPTEIEDVQIF